MSTPKRTTYLVSVRTLGRGGATRVATLASPDAESEYELYTRAIRATFGREYGWSPDLPGHPNIGAVVYRVTSGPNRGVTNIVCRVRVDTEAVKA